MVGLVKRSSVCAAWHVVDSTATECTITTTRHGDAAPTVLTYTIAMATRAGLTGSQTWRAHPEAMLRARCGAALARAVYPDVCGGLYEPDEAEEIRRHAAPVREEVPDTSLAALESWRSTLDDVASLRDMHAAWTLAAPSLHAAGRADHGRTLASERLTALGYALTLAEVQSVLSGAIDPPLATALDALADVARHADDEDGDGVCDRRDVILEGFMEGNQQLRVNGLRLGLCVGHSLGDGDGNGAAGISDSNRDCDKHELVECDRDRNRYADHDRNDDRHVHVNRHWNEHRHGHEHGHEQ
jgi:hypothetical protein